MLITMHDESDLTLSNIHEPDFTIETDEGVHAHYSALQMFAASLSLCTLSVLAAYAEQLDVTIENLRCRIRWEYADEPFRVSSIDMEIVWPEVPEDRVRAVERAAAMCTIHNTLHHPPDIATTVTTGATPSP